MASKKEKKPKSKAGNKKLKGSKKKKDPQKKHAKKLKQKYPEFGNLKGKEIVERLELLNTLGIVAGKADKLSKKQKIEIPTPGQTPSGFSIGSSQTIQPLYLSPEHEISQASESGHPFWVIAHRGWSGSYPENTLIGMREAIKLGCHAIEFDVTLSRDRKIIIIHDSTLARTTNGAGPVAEWDYADLRRLDAGSWFHPRYRGAKLPSLDEVLLISRASGIRVNIEIKKESHETNDSPDCIERQVIEKILRYKVMDRVIISSFRWAVIERIFQLAPDIKTALLHYKDVGRLQPQFLKEKYGCMAINPHCIDLTQKFVDACHSAGLKVLPFTVNTYQNMQKYFDMGVDGMFTNHPNRLFKFIHRQNRQIAAFREMDEKEDRSDLALAIQRLEEEELDKAMRRARWRTKRRLLEAESESPAVKN